jgi:hypothetical protein
MKMTTRGVLIASLWLGLGCGSSTGTTPPTPTGTGGTTAPLGGSAATAGAGGAGATVTSVPCGATTCTNPAAGAIAMLKMFLPSAMLATPCCSTAMTCGWVSATGTCEVPPSKKACPAPAAIPGFGALAACCNASTNMCGIDSYSIGMGCMASMFGGPAANCDTGLPPGGTAGAPAGGAPATGGTGVGGATGGTSAGGAPAGGSSAGGAGGAHAGAGGTAAGGSSAGGAGGAHAGAGGG